MKRRITDPMACYPVSSVVEDTETLDEAVELACACFFGCDPAEVDDEVYLETLSSLVIEKVE